MEDANFASQATELAEEFRRLFGNRLYLRASEVLSVLPMSRRTLFRWERDHLFPSAVLFGGIKAYRTAEVLQWLLLQIQRNTP